MCVCTRKYVRVSVNEGAHRVQKSLSDPLEWSYRKLSRCGRWELNPGHLPEQLLLLICEPLLQPWR